MAPGWADPGPKKLRIKKFQQAFPRKKAIQGPIPEERLPARYAYAGKKANFSLGVLKGVSLNWQKN
jgi:hypothetical protein